MFEQQSKMSQVGCVSGYLIRTRKTVGEKFLCGCDSLF